MTSNKNYPESLLTGIALKGLTVDIKTIVMPQNHKTLEDLRKAAMLAEKTVRYSERGGYYKACVRRSYGQIN